MRPSESRTQHGTKVSSCFWLTPRTPTEKSIFKVNPRFFRPAQIRRCFQSWSSEILAFRKVTANHRYVHNLFVTHKILMRRRKNVLPKKTPLWRLRNQKAEETKPEIKAEEVVVRLQQKLSWTSCRTSLRICRRNSSRRASAETPSRIRTRGRIKAVRR